MKELDRNVGETDVDQTDANPGTDYKEICWQDGKRIVELKTLAEQLNVCDGCDTPLNLMNNKQERLHGFGSYLSIRYSRSLSCISFSGCVVLSSNPRTTAGKTPRRFYLLKYIVG